MVMETICVRGGGIDDFLDRVTRVGTNLVAGAVGGYLL